MSKQQTTYISYILSTPQKVWDALTSASFTRQFFFGRAIEVEPKAGGAFALRMEDGRVDTEGKVLEWNPPRRFSVTWRVVWLEEFRHLPECIVTFDLELAGEMAKLTMTEDHPTPIEEKYLEGGRQGWPLILSGLKTLLETGRPLPKFAPMAPGEA